MLAKTKKEEWRKKGRDVEGKNEVERKVEKKTGKIEKK